MRTIGQGEVAAGPTRPEAGPGAPRGYVRNRVGGRAWWPRTRRSRLVLATLVALAVFGVMVSQGLVINGLQSDLGRSRRSDLDARTQLLASRARLQRDVDVLLGRLDTMTGLYRAQTAARNSLQVQLTRTIEALRQANGQLRQTSGRLGQTTGQLNDTKHNLDGQVIQLELTKQCLVGVQQALEKASVSDFVGAVAAVQSVDGQCRSALNRTEQAAGYPAYDGSAADPFVTQVGGTYYGYATNSIGGSVQLLTGSSPTQLTLRGPALANLASWASPGGTWGPSVLQRGNVWVLYYTARIAGSQQSCLSRAVGPGPGGPFLDDSLLPMVCQLDRGGSIDPSPTVGIDGTAWLVWKSEGVPGRDPARIWSQRLSADGRSVQGDAVGIITAEQAWEGGVVEGPALVERAGRWLLFYSGNDWATADYAIGVAVCAGPQGPCRKPQNGPIFTPPPPLVGAGGQELFTGPDGGSWMVFHAWVSGQVGYPNPRRLYVAKVDLDAPIPQIVQQRPV